MAEKLVQRLTDDGLDWIQFLDQNAACSTFPCFARDHGHPVGPGKWMNAAMQAMLDGFRKIADRRSTESGGKRRIAFSVESPPNELFMPNFHVCDQRIAPPGHGDHGTLFFPLYSFLYHEFLIIQGGFGVAPTPYHLQIRSAYNLIMGEIPGALLTGDGSLLNRGDTDAWWSPWSSSKWEARRTPSLCSAALLPCAVARGGTIWSSGGCSGPQTPRTSKLFTGRATARCMTFRRYSTPPGEKPSRTLGCRAGQLDQGNEKCRPCGSEAGFPNHRNHLAK